MSGMTVACIVIMIIITIGSVSFSFLQSQKLNDLEEAKAHAEFMAQRTSSNERRLNADLAKVIRDLVIKDGEINNLKLQLQTASQRPTQQDLHTAVLKTKADSSSQLQTLQAERAALQGAANQVPALEGKLAEYAIHGTPVEIKALLDELATMKQGTAPAPKKPKTFKPVSAGEIAVIRNYDQKFGFYTLTGGSNVGIKVGDKYSIFRNSQIVGKVVVKRVNPTVSIASSDLAFPKPPVPFKVGDKVMKLN